MAAKVYTFHITYEGLEDRIWRKVEVSSNYRLDQLGYMVLASFDTRAYHLFEFHYHGSCFEIPHEDWDDDEQMDMAMLTLYRIGLKIGDRIRMDYDFGTTQTFWLELIAVEDMKRGWGRRYPYVLEGAGRGIIDDLPCDELKLLVEQIDKNGKTDEPIYYRDRRMPWDYRWFDLDCMNGLLKGEIEQIEEGYAPLLELNKKRHGFQFSMSLFYEANRLCLHDLPLMVCSRQNSKYDGYCTIFSTYFV